MQQRHKHQLCNNQKIILASQSPRRRYLLEQAGLQFSVVPSRFDESSVTLSDPKPYVKQLAENKAGDVAENYPEDWIIGADTIVLIDGEILGKPDTRDEAESMLKKLSGNNHHVLTGYCIRCKTKGIIYSNAARTVVQFKELSEREVQWYIDTKEPFDKAGAYAIQGLGSFLVKRINGSYTNVVGLPVCEVMEFFIQEGVISFNHAES
jgi:septum formation protein